MKKILVILAVLFSMAFAPSAYAAADYAEGQVLVVMKNSSSLAHTCSVNAAAARVSAAKALAGTVSAKVQNTYDALSASSGQVFTHLRSTTKTADEMIAELKNNPNVVAVSKNYIRKAVSTSTNNTKAISSATVTKGSRFSEQWGLQKIGVEKAWQKTTGGKDVVVAVLDTGVMYNHPDLADNMWQDAQGHYGKMFYTQTDNLGYISDDQNLTQACVDITSGDISHDTDFSPAWWSHVGDICGHGTHLAGIIGAAGKQVNGVNQNVKILTVGVFSVSASVEGNNIEYDGTGGFDADIADGLNYITGLKKSGVNIVAANMSFGGWCTPDVQPESESKSFIYAALQAASNAGAGGILLCIAACNDAQDIDNPSGECLGQKPYPAYYCISLDNTLCVGASDIYDKSCVFSNYSSEEKSVSVFAPGKDILSTCIYDVPKGLTYAYYDDSGYASYSGTSMATPMVTGSAALLAAAYPNKTAAGIKQLIVNNCADACKTGFSKYGRIDLAAAMEAGTSEPSNGGCNTGFAGLALAGAAALAVLKKKH